MKFLFWLACIWICVVAAAAQYCKQNGGPCIKDSNCCSGKCNPLFRCGTWKANTNDYDPEEAIRLLQEAGFRID